MLQKYPELKAWAELGPTNQVKIYIGENLPDSSFISQIAERCSMSLMDTIEDSGYHWLADDHGFTAIGNKK